MEKCRGRREEHQVAEEEQENLPPKMDESITGCLLANGAVERHRIPLLTGDGQHVICEERMYECRLSVLFPLQLLRLYSRLSIDLKTELAVKLAPLQLTEHDEFLLATHTAALANNIAIYENSIAALEKFEPSVWFRSSTDKTTLDLAFVPINLHLQRFYVEDTGAKLTDDEETQTNMRNWICHDILTSGCCAAIPLSFHLDGGGLSAALRDFETAVATSGGKAAPDAVVASRFWRRRSALKEMRNRVDGHMSEVLRAKDWQLQSGAQESTAKKVVWPLLCQIKELAVLLNDLMTTQAVRSAADRLVILQQYVLAREDGGESTSRADSQTTDSASELMDSVNMAIVSLSTKVAALDVVDAAKNEESPLDGVVESGGFSRSDWLASCRQGAREALDHLSALCSTLETAQLLSLVKLLPKKELVEGYYRLQLRSAVCLSQALTTACSALLTGLWLFHERKRGEKEKAQLTDRLGMDRWTQLGPLIAVVSFLSCYGQEKGMMQDMKEAWNLVSTVCRFRFVRPFSSIAVPSCVPVVEGNLSELLVSLPIVEDVFALLPEQLRNGNTFKVRLVYWSLGVNHEATFAAKMGNDSLEHELNAWALADLTQYVEQCSEFLSRRHMDSVRRELERLTVECSVERRSKNLVLIESASRICRQLSGFLLYCCKSGKDRTSMAVTLAQASALPVGVDVDKAVEMMRTNGVRRTNCEKNVGRPLYAFSSLQLHFLPNSLRPPRGTFGKLST